LPFLHHLSPDLGIICLLISSLVSG